MIDIIKDLAEIAAKHKRKWGFYCDDGTMTVWIADDIHMDEIEKYEIPDQCMKIVYHNWDFGEAYFDFKNVIDTYSSDIDEKSCGFDGFSINEMKVVTEMMEYIKTNSVKISDLMETYFPYQFPDESAGD